MKISLKPSLKSIYSTNWVLYQIKNLFSAIFKMKKILKNKVLSNIFSLTLVKGLDICIPLLLIPFSVHKLGIDNYGVFATCLVTLNFLMRFTDFGINITASKKIATDQNIKVATQALSKILQTKLLLLIPALVIFYIIAICYGIKYFYVSLYLSIALICDTFTPLCFYQGLQKLKYYSFICLIWRWISAALIIIFIESKEDLFLYCLFHSFSYLGILICLFIPILSKFRGDMSFDSDFDEIKEVLSEGWQVFSFSLISSLFVPISTNFIAITNEASLVTVFNVSQRIFSSVYRFFEPINTAVFPYLSHLFSENKAAYVNKSSFIFYLFFTTSMISFICLCELNNIIIHLFIGPSSKVILWVYLISGFSLVPNVMNLYVSHVLIIIGKTSDIKNTVFISLFFLLVGIFFVYIMKLDFIYCVMVINLPSYLTLLLYWRIYRIEIKKIKCCISNIKV